MVRRLALVTAAIVLGAFVAPAMAVAPVTAAPAQIQAQCPVGSYSSTLPPYYTYWHIGGMVDGVRYWHTVSSAGSYVQSSITKCGSSGEQLWSRPLSVTATGGDRCDPSTSSIRYYFVGEYRHPNTYIGYTYYRYWHVREQGITIGGQIVWLYSHSELARC